MRNRQEQPQNLWFQTRLSTVSDRYKVFTQWEQARLPVLYLDLSVTTKRWFQSNGYKVIRLYISICDRAILQWYRKLEDSSCCSRCFTVIGSPNALFFCSRYKGRSYVHWWNVRNIHFRKRVYLVKLKLYF